ncbi:hypothetical protein GCM10010269_03910 [Streptomyces humidus]|uniref:SseB protein N-terminal domain-containing protein n=2 Tax=Streptomyces humidus TaxID=52259 RepID=A0A918L124_9ACTN|nr:hypothetical protein GCM10010269_03910 [Streptomyces humidus]
MSDIMPPENLPGDDPSTSADTSARPAGDPESPSIHEAERDAPRPVLSWPAESSEPAPGDAPEPADLPPAPEHIVDAALLAPGHWFGFVDPAWRGTWPPPTWAVAGQWRSDTAGRLVEWQSNPEYIPSPSARGWSRPTDPIDAAVQRAAAGYGGEDEVPLLVARAQVAVYVRPDGEPVTAVDPEGSPVVPVLTSPSQLAGVGRLAYEVHSVLDLVEKVPPGHALYLNPAAAVAMRLDPEALEQALAVVRSEAAAEDEAEDEGEEAEHGAEDEVAGAQGTGTPADAADRDAGPSADEAGRQDDEPVVGATRIDTSGSVPAPVIPQRSAAESDESPQSKQSKQSPESKQSPPNPPGASDVDDASGTRQRAETEGAGGVAETPAAVSQATGRADSPAPNLADGAAAMLMGASDS